jgi:hypothetical protein
MSFTSGASSLVALYCDKIIRTNILIKEGHMARGPILQLDSQGRKRCPACKEYKELNEFSMNKGKRFDRNGYCKLCESQRRRNNYSSEKQHQYNLKTFYRITKEVYDEMLVAQEGVCAICGLPETSTYQGKIRTMSVDHDHTTGAIRALLCSDCNRLVGFIERNPHKIELALAYLGRWGK